MTKFYLIISSFLLLSCDNDETSKYLFEYLQEPSNNSESYYLIDMQGCDSCIINNLDFFSKEEMDITLILVGRVHSKRWRAEIDAMAKKYTIIYDEDRMAIKMGLGLSTPLLVIAKSGNVIFKRNIKDNQLYVLLDLVEQGE